MPEEVKSIMVLDRREAKKYIASVKLFDEIPQADHMVKIELSFNDFEYSCCDCNYFQALLKLRKKLEDNSFQILCNGAAKEVYPSPMQMSMGCCRMGYIQRLNAQAKKEDIVDLFEYDNSLTPASVDEQNDYHRLWLSSIALKMKR